LPSILLIAGGSTRVGFIVHKMKDLINILLFKSVNEALLIEVVVCALNEFLAILKHDGRNERLSCGIVEWKIVLEVINRFVTTKIKVEIELGLIRLIYQVVHISSIVTDVFKVDLARHSC